MSAANLALRFSVDLWRIFWRSRRVVMSSVNKGPGQEEDLITAGLQQGAIKAPLTQRDESANKVYSATRYRTSASFETEFTSLNLFAIAAAFSTVGVNQLGELTQSLLPNIGARNFARFL